MLTLILGRGKSGKTTELLQAVKACPATGMAERIVIVPEQLSHQTERQLSQMCGDAISFTAEVLSFTRLASRVFSIYGGGARQSLDKGGRILTARLALDSIRSQLKVFASAAGKAEFLSSMVSMIDEFKSYGVTPQILADASRQVEGQFSEKLLELSLILGSYEAVMAQGTCDPRDKLTLLRQKLMEEDYAKGRHFFVDGFTDFSRQELDILFWLIRRGESVTVTLPCDGLESDAALFAPGQETAQRLCRMSEEAGKTVQVRQTTFARNLPRELTYLEENLYHYQVPAYDVPAEAITLVIGQSRLEECRHCAAVLKQAAMAGMRFRDMMVAAGDTSGYGPMLEAVCRDSGVPLYTGRKTPITAHPATAFLLCALEAAAEDMETETVTAYLRTGFAGVTQDDCDALENYAYTWAIRGSRWQKAFSEHPDGYDGRFTEETAVRLRELNRIREIAIGPLLRLRTGLRTAGNTLGQLEVVHSFLEETKLYEQVTKRLETLTAQGRQEEAQEMAQVYNALMECLQQTAGVLGKTAQSAGELLRILSLCLEQYELGTIPAALDCVQFGALNAVRGSEPKLLYVLGANEGIIPKAVSGGSLLTEQERSVLLNELDIDLAPDSEGALRRELLQLYSALTAPKEKLYLSCAAADGGESLQPSFIFERLKKLFPQCGVAFGGVLDALTASELAELYFIAEQMGNAPLQTAIFRAAEEIPDLAQRIETARRAIDPRQEQVSRQLSEQLFGAPVALTASRLDELGNCPMSFFLNYGLKARERKQAEFDAAEFGTFLHYILEKTVRELSQEQRYDPLTPEESRELVESYMGPYLSERMQDQENLTARQKYLYGRNRQEATELLIELSREFAQSEFHPCAFELQFGEGKAQPALQVEGERGVGHLDGMVDRADLWKSPQGDYLRIVDYKSGTKSFDYTDLNRGVGMQLLLYLFALEKSGIAQTTEHPMPAGAMYFPAKRKIESADGPLSREEAEALRKKGSVKPSGLVLADETVLEAMEKDLEGNYIPVKKKKTGLGDYAVSSQQMKLLQTFIEKQMGKAVDQILEGGFSPDPYYRGRSHDPCNWCRFGDVCQKDQKFRLEHYVQPLKAEDFWKQIGGDEDA